MIKIVLASRNTHKIEELRETLAGLEMELLSALDFPQLEEVEEDRHGLEGNALKKARYVHQKTGLPALADDTGLEVDALDGEPGVYSARYAGEDATYEENTEKLLNEMKNCSGNERRARFRTVAALVTADDEFTFEGVCEGEIIQEPRGDKGFGYDPVFQPEDFEKTFAELETDVKNSISHRGKAIGKFYEWLKNTGL